jgi:hypothetical protein
MSPAAPAGCFVGDYKGKEAGRLVTRIDPGMVSLVAELRGHERQAAEELRQWKTRVEERSPPRRRRLPRRCWRRRRSLSGWRTALEMEKSRGADDQVDQMSQTLNRLRAMVSLPLRSRLR